NFSPSHWRPGLIAEGRVRIRPFGARGLGWTIASLSCGLMRETRCLLMDADELFGCLGEVGEGVAGRGAVRRPGEGVVVAVDGQRGGDGEGGVVPAGVQGGGDAAGGELCAEGAGGLERGAGRGWVGGVVGERDGGPDRISGGGPAGD